MSPLVGSACAESATNEAIAATVPKVRAFMASLCESIQAHECYRRSRARMGTARKFMKKLR